MTIPTSLFFFTMHRRNLTKEPTLSPEKFLERSTERSQLSPRTRQTASLFVAEWIDNAPIKEQEIEKPKYFARTKNIPRSGPFSAMYFGNDVLLCARNRSSGEIQEVGKHRSSLRPPSASNDTSEHVYSGETDSSPAARSRATLVSSSRVSSISHTDDSPPVDVHRRSKRDKAVGAGPPKKSSKVPSNQQASAGVHTISASSSEGATSDQDLFRREREFFLKERSVFLREREQFLTDKERLHLEKEKLIQDIHREKEGIAREKAELAHQRDSVMKAAAMETKAVDMTHVQPAPKPHPHPIPSVTCPTPPHSAPPRPPYPPLLAPSPDTAPRAHVADSDEPSLRGRRGRGDGRTGGW